MVYYSPPRSCIYIGKEETEARRWKTVDNNPTIYTLKVLFLGGGWSIKEMRNPYGWTVVVIETSGVDQNY